MRTEFGIARSECSCNHCKSCCKAIPGYLIPSDLDRIIPNNINPLTWAESNLLASPGAMVMKGGEVIVIPTLVPATKPDWSCKFYDNDKCGVWESSPFGCAMFSCKQSTQEADSLSSQGLISILQDIAKPDSLYFKIWWHLHKIGKMSPSVKEKRAKLQEILNNETHNS